MRILSAVVFSGLSLLAVQQPYAVATEVEDEEEDFSSWDDDLDEDEAPAAKEEDFTLAEQADAALSEPERKLRMALCLGIARQRFAQSPQEMKMAVDMLVKVRGMAEEEASEMMHVMMIKNCYINFDQETDMAVIAEQNEDSWNQLANRLIKPSPNEVAGKQSALLPRQWDLIREVVQEESTKGPVETPKRIEVLGSKMGGFQKFAYFISVFGAIFGGGYFLVKKLVEAEREPKKKADKKATRAASAEKKETKKD